MPSARDRLFAPGWIAWLIVSGLAGCGGPGGGEPRDGSPIDAGPRDGAPAPGDPDAGSPDAGIVLPPVEGPLAISEIMYHPVLEEDFVDRHELVEIHNPTEAAVSLDGWTIEGGIAYAFPAGAELAAGAYLVVARQRDALLSVNPGVDAAGVLGDYAGELDNGRELLILRRADGAASDALVYDDDAPWPVAADAMGAGESWLRPALRPEELHRYRGYSMERVSFALPAADPANWVASALDAPTPGSANTGARAVPYAIALWHRAAPLSGEPRPIRAGDEVRLRVQISAAGADAIEAAALEYFVDDIARADEPVLAAALGDDGAAGDERAGDRVYTAVLPAQAERAIVRYRVRVTEAGQERVASPRPDDPYEWHAYYVSPVIDTTTPVYELFVDPAAWTTMYENIDDGRVDACAVRPEWNDKVPAVFVHNGHVYDVRVRYQGSRFNRTTSEQMESWPYPAPAAPSPLEVMSWRVQFPRYDRFDKRRVVLINKLMDGCPGLTAGVGMQLFAEAGVPAPRARYVRFYVNGGYYRYALDLERPGEDMLERFFDALVDQGEWPAGYEIGHLYKATGCNCDEGPYSWGDGRALEDGCGYTAAQRYPYTYDRKTHEWLGHEALIALIEGMHAARAQGAAALRAYLAEKLDVEQVLTYLAIINWSVPYDDMYHNYYLYQRREDGKWMMFPWDLDRNFGDWKGEQLLGPQSSIFVGALANPDNGNDQANYFKDSLLRAFTAEYRQRLAELNETVLHPAHVAALVDAFFAKASRDEAEQALSPVSCYFVDGGDNFKQFATERHAHVADAASTEAINPP
jgi:hypothetical protein